jgi:hypothetical protein
MSFKVSVEVIRQTISERDGATQGRKQKRLRSLIASQPFLFPSLNLDSKRGGDGGGGDDDGGAWARQKRNWHKPSTKV